VVAGLAATPHLGAPPAPLAACLAGLALAVIGRPRGDPRRWLAALWLLTLAACAALTAAHVAAARLAALERDALRPPVGARVAVEGHLTQPPRRLTDGHLLVLATPGGGVAVRARSLPRELSPGEGVRARGTVREPPPWQRDWLARQGAVRLILGDVEPTGGRRGGLPGALDAVRERAERALESGTGAPAAALLRGFVLGQDDLIADAVRDDFRRSGLAHLLAVSGQNVALLTVLAAPILALAGIPLRARLVILLALIAVYVPVAGAGPSIQRAGVMGAAGVLALAAGRPSSRWHALGLAAAATLGLDPRASADIGWQLSFAAVAGIGLLARPLARALGVVRGAGPLRRALAEGAALTLAATAATAPLIALHFGVVAVAAVPANLLVLPAVAPAMWLGMLAGAFGQIPGAPVEPLSWLGGLCAGYIAWVARVLGGRGAELDVGEPGPALVLAYALVLGLALALAAAAATRRRGLGPRRVPLVAGALVAAFAAALALVPKPREAPLGRAEFELAALDVGQGDAILVRAAGAHPVLIDTGPPDGGIAERLREEGVGRLGAVLITHPDRDHAGALADVLAAVRVERVAAPPGTLRRVCGALACPRPARIAAGALVRVGRAHLSALWPPPGAPPSDEPNDHSLVLLAAYRGFRALLTGDAEAEVAPVDPGPVDVLKVAHHGSADAGLGALLERTAPQAALISVGAGNPYGHPAPGTLAELAERGVEVHRTDEDGTVRVRVAEDRWAVE
jgi:competence protein ComEC